MKAQTILVWFYIPATPEKLSEIIDSSFEKHYTMAKSDFDWSRESQNKLPEFRFKLNLRQFSDLMAQTNRSIYLGIHNIYIERLAKQRGTLLIIALRRYKNANRQWPEKLEDIKNTTPAEIFVDPLNGDSFVYKLTEDNFTLYSKGENDIDEGGEYEDKYSDDYQKVETIKDDVKIWPKGKTAKTKQENADADQQ